MDYNKVSLENHLEWKGKIETKVRVPLENKDDLSVAYTPGVAAPCLAIKEDLPKSFDYTRRWNTVAVVTDGSAVLGLGDIGPEAGMPVMEGKCVLFKAFGDVDAVPLCIKSKEVDEIVKTVYLLSGSFGGVNLEDISAPRCFEIEKKLKECCDIPIFHDDQHGTAIVVGAGIINAMRLLNRKLDEQKCVISGAGAAGIACAKFLMTLGLKDVILCDTKGAIYEGRPGLNWIKEEMSQVTNREKVKGDLEEALKGADIFIGVSGPGTVKPEMIGMMNDGPVVFAMANPVPEIMPDAAKEAGAAVVGTGRSDFPNQINNTLVFPALFRGVFDAKATEINDDMKIAAAYALAGVIDDKNLSSDYIIPSPLDGKVKEAISKAVADAAIKSGVTRA